VSLWLTAAHADIDDGLLADRLAAALVVTADVAERLAEAGPTTIQGAYGLHRRVQHVLDAVDAERLAGLRRTVAALEREFTHVARVLERLRAMKRTFEEPPAPAARLR
jgi:hypothetical protein